MFLRLNTGQHFQGKFSYDTMAEIALCRVCVLRRHAFFDMPSSTRFSLFAHSHVKGDNRARGAFVNIYFRRTMAKANPPDYKVPLT